MGTQTVLITGASSGIGLELARLFARDHFRLILVARSKDQLEKVSQELMSLGAAETWVEVCDLSSREMTDRWIESITQKLEAKHLALDVLVNNAGIGLEQDFRKGEWQSDRNLLDLNIYALIHLTRTFLPGMCARGKGRILQLASTAAFQPGPGMALYFASKAFILSFTEALWVELKGTGVSVTALCPGPTNTRFEERLGAHSKVFQSGLPVADAPSVALRGYRALFAGKRFVVPGKRNRILATFGRLFPTEISLRIMGWLIRKPSSRTEHAKDFSAAQPVESSETR